MFGVLCTLIALIASTTTVKATSEFTLLVDVSDGLTFNVSSTTDPSSYWLRSGKSSGTFRNKAETLSVADKSLLLVNTSTSKGRDIIGSYVRTRVIWTGNTATNPPKESFFETNFRVYDSLSPNYDALGVVFEQRWPTGAKDTSNGDTAAVLSSFPSFEIPDAPTDPAIGLLQWTSPFSQNYVLQPWAVSAPHWPNLQIQNGTAAGPIVLFKNGDPFKAGDNRASMLSSFNSFMDTSPQQVDNELRYGVMGTMKHIPSDYTADTFLYLAPTPLTETVTAWGDVLLRFYGKSKEATYAEDQFTTNYIGYATDNGAYYYYNTEPSKTYEQTMHDVKDEFTKESFPYHFMQLDSWWYPKGINNGVKNWTAMPQIFPSGLIELHKSLGDMPFVAHNRYWAPDTDYAKQNGGDYEWIIEANFSLPVEQRFWDDLFKNASLWGLHTYEQDWLYTEDDGLKALTETPGLGRQWLTQMGKGAERSNINIQYCMNYPRFLLQSVEIPAVRQARASNDYIPSNEDWNNWEIGLTGILLGALGVAPFKDTFITTVNEPGNPYKVKGEPLPDFQAAVSTISHGPVMPGSGLTFTNWTLLHRSIRGDGLIMRGERAATLPDSLIYQFVFDRTSDDAPALEANYAMSTSVEAGAARYEIGVRPKTVGCNDFKSDQHASQTCVDVQTINNDARQVVIRTFYPTSSIVDSSICGWEWYSAQLITPPLHISGERAKWVPVSKQRIVHWEQHNLTLEGSPKEQVVFEHLDVSKSPVIRYADSCQLDEKGHGRLDYDARDLTHYYCNGERLQSALIDEISLCDETYPMSSLDLLLPHKGPRTFDSRPVTASE